MNVQFGFSYSYSAWTGSPPAQTLPVPTPSADAGSAPAHPPASAAVPAGSAQPYLMAYLTPAYIMAAPQMAAQGFAMPGQYAGAPAASGQGATAPGQGATASGGHVVSNPTNSLASGSAGMQASSASGSAMTVPAGGFPQFGLSQTGMAQHVVLSPVFLQIGFPVLVAYAPVSAQPPAQPPAIGAPPAPAAEDPVPVQPPAGEESEEPTATVPDGPRVSIDSLNVEDFDRFRLKQLTASLETSLKLELETRDGDRVTLDFSQLDVREHARFRGVDADGERMRLRESGQQTQRLVNMEVNGDLSEAEKAAIDDVLNRVIEVAQQFFGGSLDDAVSRLHVMDFDTSTLLDFSLEMSVTRKVEVSRSYNEGGDALTRLAGRDGQVMKTLEFLADAQRRLIDTAREVLNDPSAVKMVRSLLPPLLETQLLETRGPSPRELVEAPLARLVEQVEQVAEHHSEPEATA
jgi:hypothetical protein